MLSSSTATDEEGFRGFRVLAELKTKVQGVTIPLVPKRIFEVEGNFLRQQDVVYT